MPHSLNQTLEGTRERKNSTLMVDSQVLRQLQYALNQTSAPHHDMAEVNAAADLHL